jgi:hypothetical protein
MNDSLRIQGPPRRTLQPLVAALLLAAPLAPARGAVEACFPTVGTSPSLGASHYLANDPGFSQASRYQFNAMTTADGELWMAQDSTRLWLGVVGHASTCPPKRKTVFVLAFDIPGPGAQHTYRRLIVRPNALAGNLTPPPNSQPIDAAAEEAMGTTLDGSGRVVWGVANAPLTTQNDIFVSADAGCASTTGSWYVEMGIPLAGLGLTTGSSDFRMYFDLMQTDDNVGWLSPLVWPGNPSAGTSGCDPTTTPCAIGVPMPSGNASSLSGPGTDDNYPAPSAWGAATLKASGCGISLTGGINTNLNPDLYVTCVPGGGAGSDCDATYQNWPNLKISLTDPSVFHALVHNSSSQAAAVTANYSYYASGISGTSTPLPGGAGTNLSWTVPAGGATTGDTGAVPTSAWPAGVLTANEHVCTHVQLSGGAVPYLNQEAYQNMDFAPLSRFDAAPVIDARGFGPPPAGRAAHHFTLRTSATATLAVADGRVKGIAPNHVVEQLVWIVKGHRSTGRYVVLDGKSFELTEPASFGYVLQHDLGKTCYWPDAVVRTNVAGAAATSVPRCTAVIDPKAFGVLPASLDHFGLTLQGPGLRQTAFGDKELDVPENGAVTLTASAEYGLQINGCSGCPRLPLPTMGLLALGLVIMAPLRRRRP